MDSDKGSANFDKGYTGCLYNSPCEVSLLRTVSSPIEDNILLTSSNIPHVNRCCHTCSKKVPLVNSNCRCGNIYCNNHKYSDQHNCTFDYKQLGRNQLESVNVKITPKKVDKI